jgi:ribokinase
VPGRILVIGSANVDYVAFVDNAPRPGETVSGTRFATHAGGKGGNQAYAAARLGAPVSLLARVGDDTQGQFLTTHLAAGGVETRHVARDTDASTGVALIVVDRQGQNTIVVAPGANGRLTPADVEAQADLFTSAGAVLLQLEVPLETVMAAALRGRMAGCTVLLDPAPARPVPDELLGVVDYLTPNETELVTLAALDIGGAGETTREGEPLSLDRAVMLGRRLLRRGPSRVLVKLGAAGAVLIGPDRTTHVPAPRVPVVDTTAAGDVFNAAFAVALVGGAAESEALRQAVAAAACSVTREGAQSSMPLLDEARALATALEIAAVEMEIDPGRAD